MGWEGTRSEPVLQLQGSVDTTPYNADASLKPGTRVGRYEIVELLAMGGMAEIYIVESEGLGGVRTRSVLKRLPPETMMNDLSYLNMFINEAKLVASLPHPNIVQVFDIGEDEDSYYFVMEHLEGLNLRQLMGKCKETNARIPLDHILQIMLGVAEGLHAAHEACGSEGQPLAIVHRDVSPNNIIATSAGCVKVIDFGIAKSRNQRAQTEAGIVKGKIAYMSPEQCKAQPLDRRTDLYALGVILYEMVTGSRPHKSGYGPDLIHKITDQDCEDPRMRTSSCPDELAEIINKLLQRDVKKRYQTAKELHQDLSIFAARQKRVLTSYDLATWVQDLSATKPEGRACSVAETHALAIGTGSNDSQEFAVDSELSNVAIAESAVAPKTSARWGMAVAMFLGGSTVLSAGLTAVYLLIS
jgi:serine/threonine protein kinase